MTKNEFTTERTRIISEMLDNPDKYDIYPTTICYAQLDTLFDRIVTEENLSYDLTAVRNSLESDPKFIIYWDFYKKISGNEYIIEWMKTRNHGDLIQDSDFDGVVLGNSKAHELYHFCLLIDIAKLIEADIITQT